MRLSELGFDDLDEFSDQVYRTAARHPYNETETLAEWLAAPVALVQVEIDKLVKRKLLRQVGHHWEAQDPVRVLHEEHAEQEAELARQRAAMAAERAQLFRSGLFSDYLAGRRRAGTHAGLEVLDVSQVYPRFAELTEKTEKSIDFLLTGGRPPLPEGDIADLMVPAAARGVRMLSVWTPDAILAVRRRMRGGRLPALGQVRQMPHLPMRAVVWDTNAAMVPVNAADLRDGAFVVLAPTLLDPIIEMMSRIQEAAQPRPPEAGAADEPAAVRRRMAVLIYLDRDFDDRTIARVLRVSERTVKRDVAQLCHDLNVRSRFQLGAAAVRAGLLPRDTAPADKVGAQPPVA
jgi:hypothetical protein